MLDEKILLNMGSKISKIAIFPLEMTLISPTAARKVYSMEPNNDKTGLPSLFTIIGGVVLNGVYFASRPDYLDETQSLIYTSLPIVTNTLSGLYEWYRYKKNKRDIDLGTKILKDILDE